MLWFIGSDETNKAARASDLTGGKRAGGALLATGMNAMENDGDAGTNCTLMLIPIYHSIWFCFLGNLAASFHRKAGNLFRWNWDTRYMEITGVSISVFIVWAINFRLCSRKKSPEPRDSSLEKKTGEGQKKCERDSRGRKEKRKRIGRGRTSRVERFELKMQGVCDLVWNEEIVKRAGWKNKNKKYLLFGGKFHRGDLYKPFLPFLNIFCCNLAGYFENKRWGIWGRNVSLIEFFPSRA